MAEKRLKQILKIKNLIARKTFLSKNWRLLVQLIQQQQKKKKKKK